MDFDTEKFILEVKEREAIWDSKSEKYSNRNLKIQQWEELVNIYGGRDLPNEEKQALGKSLQKKWKNIRDNFVKELKNINNPKKSGSAAKKKNNYIYFNNLMFLKDTVTVNSTETNINDTDDGEATSEATTTFQQPTLPPKRSKKKKEDEIGTQLIGVLNKNLERRCLEEDEDRMFFLSLVKDFKKLPEHIRVHTKFEIMRVLRDAQYNSFDNPTWEFQRQQNRGYITNNSPAAGPSNQGHLSVETQNNDSPASVESVSSQYSEMIDLFNSE